MTRWGGIGTPIIDRIQHPLVTQICSSGVLLNTLLQMAVVIRSTNAIW